MKINNWYGRCFCFFLLFFWPVAGAGAFALPEKLIYDLSWGGIKAGTATLEIAKTPDALKITSTARSADWISIFYTVDDTVESTLSAADPATVLGTPLSYRIKLREGRHRRNKEVIFDVLRYKAECRDYIGNEKREVEVKGRFFDPLAGLYYMRTVLPEVGKSGFIDIFDSRKISAVEVKVLRRERISTPAGDFDTIVIKPLLRSEGLFTRRGEIYIWLTSDAKHIPVKMQTKVSLGRITAKLAGGTY